jgi:hypothetical protein
MSGSEKGSWRAISRRYAPRLERNDQQLRFNDLDRQRSCQCWILDFQRNEAQRVNVEDAHIMLGLAGIGLRAVVGLASRSDVVPVMVRVGGNNIVIGINVRLHHVDGCSMLLVDFVRVRLRGASYAGPHKRGSQNGRKELTREVHG